MAQRKVYIRGMHCRSCELLLEDDLGKITGIKKTLANFRSGTVLLTYEGDEPRAADIERTVEAAGYAVSDGPPEAAVPWLTRDMEKYGLVLFSVAVVFILFLIGRANGWFTIGLGTDIDPTRLSLILLVGLAAGVSTCAALIGGLVLGLSSRYSALHPELSFRQRLIPQAWFHAGRIGGFALFGALLGFIGEQVSSSIGFTALLTLFAGLVMLFLGVQLTGLSPRLSEWSLALPKSLARRLGVSDTGDGYSHRGALVLGALTFFLPCGFTQAVQLAVIASGSALLGAIALPVFAVGTLPGLLALGGFGSLPKGTARTWLFPFIAVCLIGFGGWNISSGLQLFGINAQTLAGTNDTVNDTAGFAPLENGVQVVRIMQDARGYHPSNLPTLRIGVPARIIVDSRESYTCAATFVVPAFDIQRQLKPGENIIDFTPEKQGNIAFSCSMGMFRGALTVANE